MQRIICDIHGIDIHDPKYFTRQYLDNNYVKANNLARHIHVYNQEMSRVNYQLFHNLQAAIHILTETEQVRFFDGVVRSEPLETTQTTYTFNSHLELLQLTTEKDKSKTTVRLLDSLKQPTSIQIQKWFDNVETSKEEILLNGHLEYEQITRYTFPGNEAHNWTNNEPGSTRYGIKAGNIVQKIHNRNNQHEQSKTVIHYNDEYQVTALQAFSQKNKAELLYELIFHYNNRSLHTINFTRHAAPGNYTKELIFKYNDKGLLTSFHNDPFIKSWMYDEQGNSTQVQEYDINGVLLFETNCSYTYDNRGNWITKKESRYRQQQSGKVKFQESATSRIFEYY
jgi:YD repeat-containing protein